MKPLVEEVANSEVKVRRNAGTFPARPCTIHKNVQKEIEASETVPDSMVRCDYMKLLYAHMLNKIEHSKVRLFWAKYPIQYKGKFYSDKELYQLLWDSAIEIPFSYVVTVFNGVEQFFVQHGLNFQDFITTLISQLKIGAPLSTRDILTTCKMFFDEFLMSKDPRSFILRNIHHFSRMPAPDFTHHLIALEEHSHRERGNTVSAVIVFSPRTASARHTTEQPPVSHLFVSKASVTKPAAAKPTTLSALTKFDCESWVARMVQASPACFNLPMFELMNMIADCREIGDIISPEIFTISNNRLRIDGTEFGNIIPLSEFLKEKEIDFRKLEIPDCRVVRITRDYVCPVRRRTVLHRNCAYASPLFLYEFHYKIHNGRRAFFEGLVKNLLFLNQETWKKNEQIHRKFVNETGQQYRFVYYTKECLLTINDKYFARGVPARILAKMAAAFVKGENARFSNKELVADREIISEPSNPNLTIRLQRISSILSKRFPQIRIVKLTRGQVAFEPDAPIFYTEL